MLHITFTASGAGCLRRALRKTGVRQRVMAYPDDLSFGSIDRPDSDDRLVWMESNLRPPDARLSVTAKLRPMPPFIGGFASLAEETREFWSVALAADTCTAWMTRRVPSEYCGFLAWVERAGDKAYNVVDVTDARSSADRRMIFSIAQVDPEHVDYEGLLASAAPLEHQAREEYLRLWRALRSENAALRVLVDGKLVSASITFFDDLLLSCVGREWERATRVAGKASAATWDKRARQGSTEIMMARLFSLLEARRVESKGDLNDWWRSAEVRLSADAQ